MKDIAKKIGRRAVGPVLDACHAIGFLMPFTACRGPEGQRLRKPDG